jgi:hypothetical protein
MKARPDLLDKNSPKGIEVFQLTAEPDMPSSHVYMEAQIFTLDSKRFLLHRFAAAHGDNRQNPEHRYLLCDIENDCALAPITHEAGATAPAVSPDGRYIYYVVDETEVGGGRLTLKRVGLDGSDRRTIMVVDANLPGTGYRPSHVYSLSTISSDGRRLALAAFLGDGRTDDAPFGLMVFDLEAATVHLAISGQTWLNLHPQYSRSLDPAQSHDILIQENHGNRHDAFGRRTALISAEGADIHVIRDDGANLRDMPWGRDGNEFCQGHQCWRGRSDWAITSTSNLKPSEEPLIEAQPAPHVGHVGLRHPQGRRNDLSRSFAKPCFFHFGVDINATALISDAGPAGKEGQLSATYEDGFAGPGGRLFYARFGEAGKDALREWRYLLTPRTSWRKDTHMHPFLSPDGKMAFFNSDESGALQAYMIRGLENIR